MHICFRDYLPTIEIIVPAWRRIKFVTANKEYGFYYEETSSFCDNCLLDLTSWKILDFFLLTLRGVGRLNEYKQHTIQDQFILPFALFFEGMRNERFL